MAKKQKGAKTKLQSDSKTYAFLAVFLNIIGFIIALLAKKDDEYVMFYAKQSLILFFAYLVSAVIAVIPLIGWVLSPILYIATFILWVIGWVYSLSGELKFIPLIGKYAEKIKL